MVDVFELCTVNVWSSRCYWLRWFEKNLCRVDGVANAFTSKEKFPCVLCWRKWEITCSQLKLSMVSSADCLCTEGIHCKLGNPVKSDKRQRNIFHCRKVPEVPC